MNKKIKPFENEVFIKKGKKRSKRLDKIELDDFVRLGFGTREDYYKLVGKPELTRKEVLLIEAEGLGVEGFKDMTIKELEKAIEKEAGN